MQWIRLGRLFRVLEPIIRIFFAFYYRYDNKALHYTKRKFISKGFESVIVTINTPWAIENLH